MEENGNTPILNEHNMINKYAIESAYTFFHQKQRVYQYSTLNWQLRACSPELLYNNKKCAKKDDIEYAIEDYVSQMDSELYELISGGRIDFLRNHTTFAEDILHALEQLEQML